MPKAFKLVHLTDFHLFQARGASWRAFANKRFLSWLSWRLHRGRKSDSRILDAFIDFMPALNWDQVVITGDLTHMGLPHEHRYARSFLDRIGPPERVFVIPGNHDALMPPIAETFFGVWTGYMAASRRPSRLAGSDDYPVIRLCKGVALIGLSSACPTPPFSAAGRLGKNQLRRLAAILETTGRQRLFRLLLIHHPPVIGQVKPRKALRDAAELNAIIARCGAELILHGHTHQHAFRRLPGPAGAVPVFGLPSSTSGHAVPAKRACLRMYTVQPLEKGWHVRTNDYRLTPDGRMAPVAVNVGTMSWQAKPNFTL